jgi:hypothetical protein
MRSSGTTPAKVFAFAPLYALRASRDALPPSLEPRAPRTRPGVAVDSLGGPPVLCSHAHRLTEQPMSYGWATFQMVGYETI